MTTPARRALDLAMSETPRTWTFTVHGKVNSANADHAAGRWAVTRLRSEWRAAGYYHAKNAKVPPLGAARVDLVIHLRNHRRADPQNYPSASSVKGLLDGLVAAKVIGDDRPPYLDLAMPTLAPAGSDGPRVDVTITEVQQCSGRSSG